MNKNRVLKGILFGAVAGVIDVIPMIVQNLSWDANISAFAHWIIAGFVISVADIKVNGALKGLVISALLLIPVAILIGWSDATSLIPIAVMTVILGSCLGFAIEKFA